MDKMELLQDLSVDFSQLVKKHIKGLKKLSSKDQKAFGKLFGDFKDGLDDLSTNESVNEAKYNYKQDAMDAYMKGKISAKELDRIAKEDFKSSVATKKELQGFLDSGYMKSLMANTYGLKVPAMEKKVKELMRFAESVTLKEEVESLTELSSTQEKMIYFAMGVFRLPGMNRILYKWVTDPKARKGSIKLSDEDIKMMFDEFNIKLPKNAFKEDLNNESVNEAEEPEIITQLRKGGYQTLKDPQTGKKHKVDNYSSSAIVAVYDALKKDKVKEKFVNLPLPKMVNVAFKAMK